jgi:hypothetical protein
MASIYLLDWVSFTSKIHSEIEFVELLGMGENLHDFQFIKGARGYQDRLYYGGISVHFNGKNVRTGLPDV